MSVLPIEVPSGSSKTWGSSNPFWSSQYSHWKWHLDHLRLWDHLQSFWIITDNTSMNKILFHPILRLKRVLQVDRISHTRPVPRSPDGEKNNAPTWVPRRATKERRSAIFVSSESFAGSGAILHLAYCSAQVKSTFSSSPPAGNKHYNSLSGRNWRNI